MNELLNLLLALLEGALLGVFFFAGLYWTVQKMESSQQVALLFFGSMLLRTSVVVLGFYFILDDNWRHLIAGLLGFVAARILVTRLTRVADQSKPLVRQESHEPEPR